MIKDKIVKIATLDEFSEDKQQKIYNKEISSYCNLSTEPLNIEMKNILETFLKDYGIELSIWDIDEYRGYEYRIKYNDILFSLRGKSLKDYISGKYKEVQGYITIYADNHLTDCIKEFLESNNDNETFESLFKKCLNKFFASWQEAMQFYTSFEHFKADAISNQWYYNMETLKFEE